MNAQVKCDTYTVHPQLLASDKGINVHLKEHSAQPSFI